MNGVLAKPWMGMSADGARAYAVHPDQVAARLRAAAKLLVDANDADAVIAAATELLGRDMAGEDVRTSVARLEREVREARIAADDAEKKLHQALAHIRVLQRTLQGKLERQIVELQEQRPWG